MFFLWYLLNFLIIINSCISDQSCIDSCQFDFDIHTNFTLPSKCTLTRRDQCSVILTFDYMAQIIKVDFGSESYKQRDKAVYETDNVVTSVINLEEPSFIQHTVKYYCSTGDNCDLNYVKTKAIPLYTPKACQDFRTQLIRYLYPDPASSHRDCLQNDNTTLQCDLPCDLLYNNPNQITRSCDGQVDLAFETTVGQSTPINKPEYTYRIFAYACTTSSCNGLAMQNRIQRLIALDNGECMIFLNDTIQTTTAPYPSMITQTTTHPNHARTFSKSFISIIFSLCFIYFCL